MNDRDRKDLFTVEDPFEDEQAPAPAIAADAPGARQAAEAPFCEPGLDAVIASAFDRMGPSAAAEERMLAALIATCGDGAAAADLARRGPVERTGAVRGARRLRAGKVLLPAAACLVLLAGVGALAYQGLVAAQLNAACREQRAAGPPRRPGSLPASRTARLPKTSARRPTEPRTAHPRQAETTAPRARPRPAALQRRPPPTVRSTRALPATAPAPARAARSSRSPPARSYTSQPTRRDSPSPPTRPSWAPRSSRRPPPTAPEGLP